MTAKRFFATLLLLLACAWAHAQVAGTTQFVLGQVEVERGGTRAALAQASAVNVGDVIVTGADGIVQLVMVDAGRISMRPGTRLRIDDYRYDPANAGATGALLTMTQGLLRAFTGEIVTARRRDFHIRTPIANVGVRGSGNILAHDETLGTINHTLTGAHSVTSVVSGLERTLVSYPGQTIQVRPGQPPRFIPTPPLLFASAHGGSGAAPGDAAAAPASADAALATGTGGAAAATAAASAATTVTAVSALAAFQPTPGLDFEISLRFSRPFAGGGFEGALAGAGTVADSALVFDSAGRLVRVMRGDFATFIPGPGLPAGYVPTTIGGASLTFVNGQFADGFRASDGSVILGRWQGGEVVIAPADGSPATVLALGNRSIPYVVNALVPASVIGAFTGNVTYNLVAATAPTDVAGHAGTVTSATVQANFASLAVSGTMALSVNGANYALTGSSAMARGNPHISFASAVGTLGVTCSGNCQGAAYQGTWGGVISGRTGEWLGMAYRVNPAITPGGSLTDFVSGALALRATTQPGLALAKDIIKAPGVFVRPPLAGSRSLPREVFIR